MERERLRVETFACLREVDLEVGGINILIGPQATGKSVLAKLLYFFQGFADAMLDSIMSRESEEQFRSERLSTFETYFPAQYLGTGAFDVCHSFSPDAWIRISRGGADVDPVQLVYSKVFKDLYDEVAPVVNKDFVDCEELDSNDNSSKLLIKRSINEWSNIWQIQSRFVKAGARNNLNLPLISQTLIPAGRTFFSQPETLSYRFMKEGVSMDPFLVEFGAMYGNAKTHFLRQCDSGKLASILPLIENVLRGNYVRKNEKDYLALSDGRRVDLLFASSGQQEFLPLAITLAKSLFGGVRFDTVYHQGEVKYIEEPEAHLFPTSQHEIVKLMATVFNNAVQPLRLVITTHSPYILTAFNNLIQAGETREKLDKSRHPELFRIVPEDQILAPDAVCAYEVDHGTATPIRSEETGNLILAERLDGVSTEILSAFDKLLDLE